MNLLQISETPQIVKNEENISCVECDSTDPTDVDVIQTPTNTSVKKLMIIVDTNVWIRKKYGFNFPLSRT